ncbi:MAG TPA: IPT/TIG domain-containing protein [Candidatus Acidoferrales bacterium]|nr:IPT/TIG domain-containing protein [Candidatus Acidoferrales bacterium]
MPTAHRATRPPSLAAAPATSVNPLIYQGGPIVTSPRVYISFWGSAWASGGNYTTVINYVEGFFKDLGGSDWLSTLGQYCQGIPAGAATCPPAGTFIQNPTGQYGGAHVDANAVPLAPTSSDIAMAAARAAAYWGNPGSSLYVVMTPAGDDQSGFNTIFCAYHSYTAGAVPYAYLPFDIFNDPACFANSVVGPLDGFSIAGGHEYAEILTDPGVGSGWFDATAAGGLGEVGDKCAPGYGGPMPGTVVMNQQTWPVQPLFSNQALAAGVSPCVFFPAPVVSVVSPASGPSDGGTVVSITGWSFQPGATVTFGSAPAPRVTVVSATLIQAITPRQPVGSVAVSVSNTDGGSATVPGAYTYTAVAAAESVFTALPPVRVLDTRAPQCTGANPCSPLGPNATLTLQVAGLNGVPSNPTAVVVNVGVTDSRGASSSYIELWPADAAQPNASTLNFVAGQTVANMAQVPVSASGAIDIFNAAGYVDVFIDLSGYYAPGPASGPGLYHPLATPVRYLDTRQSWDPTRTSPLGPSEIISLGIAGARPAECVPTPALCSAALPVPSTATAVVMNLAEVNATANSYLQVWPAGSAPPVTSNLNFPGGRFALANRVIVPVDPTTGMVSILNSQGFANVLVDVVGYITGSVSDTGDRFVPVTPFRVADTRNGQGLAGGVPARLGPNAADVVAVSGLPADAAAVAVSIGVLNASSYSYLALLPNLPLSPPPSSDVNFQVGDILASADLVRVTGDQFWTYNSAGSADFFVDVSGIYLSS